MPHSNGAWKTPKLRTSCDFCAVCVILTPTVLGAGEDDWQLRVKRDAADVVAVALQGLDAGFVLADKVAQWNAVSTLSGLCHCDTFVPDSPRSWPGGRQPLI